MKHSTLLGSSLNLERGTIQKLEKFPETDHIHQASPSVCEQEGLLRGGVQPGELPRRDKGPLSCLVEEAQTNYNAQKSQSPTCGVPVGSRFLYFMSHYAFWGRLCWHGCVRVISASANNFSPIIFTITPVNLIDEITKVGFGDSLTLVRPQTPSESE